MSDDVEFRLAQFGSEEVSELIALCEIFREATADYVTGHEDPRLAMGLLMAALPHYAGQLFATLLFMGEVSPKDQARTVKMVAHNFRDGVKVGLRRTTRVARERGFMGEVN